MQRRGQAARKQRPLGQRRCALVVAAATCGTFVAFCAFFTLAPPLESSPGLITVSRREEVGEDGATGGGQQLSGGAEANSEEEPRRGGDGSVGGLRAAQEEEGGAAWVVGAAYSEGEQGGVQQLEVGQGGEGGEEEEGEGVIRPEVTSIQPFTAPAVGGVVVTITGFNLWRSSATKVDASIGGSPCMGIVRNDPGSIECILPGGVGRGLDVSVAVQYGEEGATEGSAVSRPNQLFSYSDPEVHGVLPQQGRSSGGTRLTIRGTNFGPSSLPDPPQVLIGGKECLNTERFSDSVLHCISPPHVSGVSKVVVRFGPIGHQITAAQEPTFVHVKTPAERLLEAASAAFMGLNLRFAEQHPDRPITMNKQGVDGQSESMFVDQISNRTRVFHIPPHVLTILPDKDYSKRFKTCAVVGESHSLLGAGKGGEIDGHHAVLRLAHIPASGFEAHVGRKTTFRVGTSDFLLAIATANSDSRGWTTSTFLKEQARLKTPTFLWDPMSHDLAAAASKPLGPGSPAANILLAAPWLQSARQSSYDTLFRRHTTYGILSAAVDAALASSDEATAEQAAEILRDSMQKGEKRGSEGSEAGEGWDGVETDAGADQKDHVSAIATEIDFGEAEAQWKAENEDASDNGQDLEEDGTNGEMGDSQDRRNRRELRKASERRGQTGRGKLLVGGKEIPSVASATEAPLQLSSDPIQQRHQPSVEFDALLLALQLCSEVDVYGFPELTQQQVEYIRQGWNQTTLPLEEAPATQLNLNQFHPYRFNGVYYSEAPQHVLLLAMAASGAARLAADLGPGSASMQGSGADVVSIRDLQRQAALEQQRRDRKKQIEFETVLWRLMSLKGLIHLR